MDFGDHLLDWFELVIRRQQDRTGAEFAFMRAAATGLNGNAIVFFGVEQIEARHRGLAQIKLAVRRLTIKRLETAVIKILEHLRPQRFPFPNNHTGAVCPGFFRK